MPISQTIKHMDLERGNHPTFTRFPYLSYQTHSSTDQKTTTAHASSSARLRFQQIEREQQQLQKQKKSELEAHRQQEQDDCMRHATHFCRSIAAQLTVKEALPAMGQRPSKSWFLAESGFNEPTQLLTLSPVSSNCRSLLKNNASRACFRNFISNMQHPYLLPVTACDYRKDQELFFIVRPFVEKGSIRDVLHKNANPKHTARIKYGTSSRLNSLHPQRVSKFGRQILEGIAYTESCGVPSLHLHAGNVLLDNGVCRISEWENSMLGLHHSQEALLTPLVSIPPPPSKNPIPRENRSRPLAKIDPTVLSFGHLIFEMATGYSLEIPKPKDSDYRRLPESMHKVIQGIFSPETLSITPVTVSQLLLHPFFRDSEPESPRVGRDPTLFVDEHVREVIKLLMTRRSSRGNASSNSIARRNTQPSMEKIDEDPTVEHEDPSTARNNLPPRSAAPSANVTSNLLSVSTAVSNGSLSIRPPPPPLPLLLTPPAPAASTHTHHTPMPTPIHIPATTTSAPAPVLCAIPPPSVNNANRNGLLSSISGFNKTNLKRAVTADRSRPVL
eukprot:GILJ01012551.1.p1 GENE.GILJ01012551.1~~GILJ01012551.1.p1  ORF type:complete len:558 (+),score=66.51 GILJ01012551.1:287-1960(+)